MSFRLASAYAYSERPYPQPEASPAPGRDDGFVETAVVWRVLWDRKTSILASAAACVAAALLYGLVSPSLYTATTQVIVDPRDRQVVSNDVNPSAVAPDGGIAQIESQVSVMQSNGVLLGAIAATNLIRDSEFNGVGLLGRLTGFFRSQGATDGPLTELQARTLGGLRRNLAVKRADKVLVIDVSITSRDPEKAANIANAIAESYLADQARARAEAARRASGSLSGRLEEQRRRVEEAEQAIETYRAENRLVATGGRLVSDQQLNELNTQLTAAQNQTALLRAQMQNQSRGRDSTSEAQRSAVITKLREQESVLAENVANLATNLGPRHPSLAAAQAQLRNVRDHISLELGRVGKALRVDYERAAANERALAARLEQHKALSLTNDKASVRLRELQRELDTARSVYASFLQRARETGEQASIDTTNARVITRALPPLQRSWPPLSLLVIGAGLAGLGLGAGAALAREYVKPRVMSASQARSAAGAAVVAVLPPEIAGAASGPDTRGDRAIRLLLAGLMGDDTDDVRAARSIVLTSSAADASERRAIARALARIASGDGERVLLVDADVANAKEASSTGLLDLLRGEETLGNLVRRDGDETFYRLDKGRAGSPVAISRRNIDGSIFARMRRKVDLLVVDAGVAGENHLVAPFLLDADAVLVVARVATTHWADLRALSESIALIGAPASGVLLVDDSRGA